MIMADAPFALGVDLGSVKESDPFGNWGEGDGIGLLVLGDSVESSM